MYRTIDVDISVKFPYNKIVIIGCRLSRCDSEKVISPLILRINEPQACNSFITMVLMIHSSNPHIHMKMYCITFATFTIANIYKSVFSHLNMKTITNRYE